MCGIFGILNYSKDIEINAIDVIKTLAINSEIRGKDATGISYINNNKIVIDKKPLAASKFDFQSSSDPQTILGHVRLATQGKPDRNYNNHPFLSLYRRYSLAHNGVLFDTDEIKKSLDLKRNKIETDTYLAVQLLDDYNGGYINFKNMKNMSESVFGQFLFTILDLGGNIWMSRDGNPVSIYNFYNMNLIIYASTEQILLNSCNEFTELSNEIKNNRFQRIKVLDGDILKISSTGKIQKKSFEPLKMFEKYYMNDPKYNPDEIYDSYPCYNCEKVSCIDCNEYESSMQYNKNSDYPTGWNIIE